MALLLRMGGVPARVADRVHDRRLRHRDESWLVTDIDAHAWVEAWFPHYGWVTFDPTPAAAPARGGRTPISSSALQQLERASSTDAAHPDTLGAPTTSVTDAHHGLAQHRSCSYPGSARGACSRSGWSPGARIAPLGPEGMLAELRTGARP